MGENYIEIKKMEEEKQTMSKTAVQVQNTP